LDLFLGKRKKKKKERKKERKLSKYRRFNHMFFQKTHGEREREVWLQLAISAMFSSLQI